MLSKRVLVAKVLDRLRLPGAFLDLRQRAWPWRWLTVLTYHRLGVPSEDPFPGTVDATPAEFERQVAYLTRHFTLVDTKDLRAFAQGQPLPPNPAMITFDDGYRDNHDQAFPILLRYGAKAVFFVASDYLNRRRLFWWDRITRRLNRTAKPVVRLNYPYPMELPLRDAADKERAVRTLTRLVKDYYGLNLELFLEELDQATDLSMDEEERSLADRMLMTWDQVRSLEKGGMDVESHSHTHRVLQTLPPSELASELSRSRQELEGQLDRDVHALAYPCGLTVAQSPFILSSLRASGFEWGFASKGGVSPLAGQKVGNSFDMKRIPVDFGTPEVFFHSMLAFPSLTYK